MSTTGGGYVSVLIADDHASIRSSLRDLLRDKNVQVVSEAANGQEAVWQCERLHPDVVVLDISMPLMNGFEAAQEITARCPATKIIFLTGHIHDEYVREALRVGGVGFVSKKRAILDLPIAIEAVMEGKTYVSRDAA